MLRWIVIALTTAVCVESCAGDDGHFSRLPPDQKLFVTVCPMSAADDVKQFLGVDLNEKVEVTALLANAKAKGYIVDYRLFFSDTFECSDRTLKGSKQHFVTLGWGQDQKGSEVFRTFVVVADTNGTLTRIETRYSYKIY